MKAIITLILSTLFIGIVEIYAAAIIDYQNYTNGFSGIAIDISIPAFSEDLFTEGSELEVKIYNFCNDDLFLSAEGLDLFRITYEFHSKSSDLLGFGFNEHNFRAPNPELSEVYKLVTKAPSDFDLSWEKRPKCGCFKGYDFVHTQHMKFKFATEFLEYKETLTKVTVELSGMLNGYKKSNGAKFESNEFTFSKELIITKQNQQLEPTPNGAAHP